MDKILVSLPNFYYDNAKTTLKLLEWKKEYPTYFKDNVEFDTVYDCFPCIWNGGRYYKIEKDLTKEDIINTLEPFFKMGIKIRHNFTNKLLEQKHLNDYNGNLIIKYTIELCKKYNTSFQIAIASELLYEYLNNKYENLNFIWSTTLGPIGKYKINELTKKDMIVLDYMYNNNFNFLKSLNNPEHIEILSNENCPPNCKYRMLHWYWASEAQLYIGNKTPSVCLHPEVRNGNGKKFKEKFVSIEDCKSKYLPIGINKIKIVGRGDNYITLMTNYINFFIKPEYQAKMKKMAWNCLTHERNK